MKGLIQMETYGLEKLGLTNFGKIYRNLSAPVLVEHALSLGEGKLAANGALNVLTGKYTGRSPEDKFIVDEPSIHDEIMWGKVNKPFTPEKFEALYNRLKAYLQAKDLYIFDGYVGNDLKFRLPIRIVNELAYQNLFVRDLFVRPTEEELANHAAEFTCICAPGFKAVPEVDGTHSEAFIIVSFERKLVIIGGSGYAGEMKKSMFSVMNFLLPNKGGLPMHCSCNVGKDGDVALFFGLSGTGKTTLSADPERGLVGDDEHGWSDSGVFNFEGGCYAKTIRLSKEGEPEIYNAIRFGSLLENVVMDDETRIPDYDDDKYTENTRAAYPIEYIPNAIIPGVVGHPKTVIFLTADAYGVLPPISKLTKEEAMYQFLSGYTSKLAGTERGITEPQATFSTCFGAPFLPHDPMIYADLLGKKITEHNTNVFLVNTGWVGGRAGDVKRIKLSYTRAMVRAALNGDLDKVEYTPDPIFKVLVPKEIPNSDVPSEVLNPENAWKDKEAYKKNAKELAGRFVENFKKFKTTTKEVVEAGPEV